MRSRRMGSSPWRAASSTACARPCSRSATSARTGSSRAPRACCSRSNSEPVPWTGAPTIYQFVKTDEQRQMLEYFSSSIEYGRPLLLPPEVPAARVRMLRRAFEATVNDPQFRDEAHKLGFEITLRTGEQLEALIRVGQGSVARDHRARHEDHPVARQLRRGPRFAARAPPRRPSAARGSARWKPGCRSAGPAICRPCRRRGRAAWP